MRAHLTLNFLVSAFLALTGCATHPTPQRSANSASDKNDRSSPHDKALAKKGQKTLPETSKVSLDIPPNSQTNSASKDLTKTFNRLNDPSMQLMDEDIQTATALHPAAKASMEEAVLVLAQLRLLKTQLDQSSQFQSHDLYDKNSPPEASSTKKISMEKLFRDLDLDLLNSFTTNSNLKNLPTLALLKSLLDKTENSKDFTTSIQSLIDLEAQKWAALQKPNNTPDAQQTPLPPPPSPPVASATAAPSPETSAIGSNEVHTAAT
ncbi:MAG: hypothetical protein NTX25_01210, partial [Proteobacteria bacterium]|nr:hypothetical protein [Pseudomonadota bacterium]